MAKNRLKLIRNELDLSVTEVAKLTGVAYQTIVSIEAGHTPRLATKQKIASGLDRSIDDIFPVLDLSNVQGVKAEEPQKFPEKVNKVSPDVQTVHHHKAADTITYKQFSGEELVPFRLRGQEMIKLTELELNAYALLAQGYKMLAGLPENQSNGQREALLAKSKYYLDAGASCKETLNKLVENF